MPGRDDRRVRTTVRLEPSLFVAAKKHAVETGRSLTRLIEDALRLELARHDTPKELPPLVLLTPSGLRPGVDLDDNARTRDLMDDL